MGLFDVFKPKKSFENSVLGKALRAHVNDFFYSGTLLSDFKEGNKRALIDDMYQKLVDAQQSENPVMTLRETLADFVTAFSGLMVLALTEEEKAEVDYGKNPYISGTLHRHIDAAAEYVPELKRHKWESEQSGKDLVSFCNVRTTIYLFYMNAINMALIEIGDKTEPHWYRPLVEAALVWQENQIRMAMEMPLTTPDEIDALAYGSFMDRIVDGEPAPFYDWCLAYPALYLDGRGPTQTAPI